MTTLIIFIFVIGYLLITLEQLIKINKAAIALITAVLCWTAIITNSNDTAHVIAGLSKQIASTSEIVFFLLGAMTIVELIDAHDGFQSITDKIKTTNKSKLIWTLSILTFFLSAVLDNLTTTIVMVSILNKLIQDKKIKWLLLGLVIIAANAGGAWSPIGDVTTTMLWIGGQITPLNIIKETFIASLVCMIIPTLIINYQIKGNIEFKPKDAPISIFSLTERNLILFTGITVLIFVPVFTNLTHLPPYMGMLLSLGVLWIVTLLIQKNKEADEKNSFSISHALRKIDTPSILFFLGILMSIASLEYIEILPQIAKSIDKAAGNVNVVAISIGILSSVVDNVPLVAALQSMYGLDKYPTDHYFWELLVYCAGTGGSCLIIGSAAGVAVMGIEKIDFFWYLKNVSWIAVIGFLSGAAVFIIENEIILK